ncbi:G protein-coupled receptor associated sorting protein 3-like [Tenrec ecaudatus]|uniref:G protein-coupled receptor associated sorting protein 3-like n=1 Tax=Tenrec ecaudatus TaxID=94439 RepID=UPI003F5A0965
MAESRTRAQNKMRRGSRKEGSGLGRSAGKHQAKARFETDAGAGAGMPTMSKNKVGKKKGRASHKNQVAADQKKGALSQNQAVAQQKEGAVPKYQAVAQQKEGTIPKYQAVAQQKEGAVPKYQMVAQQKEGAVPQNQAVAQQKEGAVPKYHMVSQQKEGAVPQNQAVAQQKEGAVPKYHMVSQQKEGAVPKNQAVAQQKEGAVPKYHMVSQQKEGAVPKNQAVAQQKEGAVPKYHMVSQQKEGAVPKYQAVAQQKEGAVPKYQAVAQQKEGAVPKYRMVCQQKEGAVPKTPVAGLSKYRVLPEHARAFSELKAMGIGAPKPRPKCSARCMHDVMPDIHSFRDEEALLMSFLAAVARASVVARSAPQEKTDSDAWFWSGEEPSIGAWFWGEEEADEGSSSGNEDEAVHGASASVVELGSESATGAECPLRSETEEEDAIFGSWFWDGDETSFDPNPRPVYRIIKPQAEDEFDWLRDWDPSAIPALLAFASQLLMNTRPPSYIALSSERKKPRTLPPEEVSLCEGTNICLQSIQAYPLDSEVCARTIEEIRRELRIRKLNGIKPFSCPCKMECCVDAEEFERLVSLLQSNADPLIHKIAQIAMGVIKVNPFVQQLVNEMGVLTVIESFLDFQTPDVTKKAEITLNPISVEERQRMIELHVVHMCKEAVSFPLNSPGQLSALKELGQLTVDSDLHYIVTIYLTDLFNTLAQGNRKTRNTVLKILLNMSENPIAARDMIDLESLSALKVIFNQKEAKANLVTAVAIFVNIKEHIRKGSIIVVNPSSYNELKAMFREVKAIIEKL